MGNLQAGETIVKRGVFIYAGAIECDIRIVLSPVQYGSGDWEDPPETQGDQVREAYCVQYGSTTHRGVFTAGAGSFSSLEAAMAAARAAPGIGSSIRWLDPNP